MTVKTASKPKSMSLAEFRKHALKHECVCCSKFFKLDELQPAVVTLTIKSTNILNKPVTDEAPVKCITRAGMVCKSEKGGKGKKDSHGNHILTVTRKNIKVRIEESSRGGQPFYVEDK